MCGQCFTICSAHDPERRITFASDGFLKMTGYTNEQVIGKPALFLVVSPTHDSLAVYFAHQLQGWLWSVRPLVKSAEGQEQALLGSTHAFKSGSRVAVVCVGVCRARARRSGT